MDEMKQKTPVTLDEIIQLKKSKKEEIKVQKEVLSNQAKEIFSPFRPFTSKGLNIIQKFNTGMWGGIFNLAVEGLGKYLAAASGLFMMFESRHLLQLKQPVHLLVYFVHIWRSG